MLYIILIFLGLAIGNYIFYFMGKTTIQKANDRTFFQFVFGTTIYVILFSGWIGTPFKLVQ